MLHIPRRLAAALQRSIGRDAAIRELKWMRDSQRTTPRTTLQQMVARRLRGEPLQYILGTQPFGPLTLLTRPPVLIPRPETEHWVLRLSLAVQPTPARPASLLDLCTGSGCIPLLLCHIWPPGSVRALGVDISEAAVHLAADNAAACGVTLAHHTPSAGSVDPAPGPVNTFAPLLADMRDPAFARAARMCGPHDVITSNPPYIPRREYDALPRSVKHFEDPRALLGDPGPCSHSDPGRGLSFYHTIAELVRDTGLLKNEGVLAVEVGAGQAADVARILEHEGGMRGIEIWKDPWKKERTVVARK